MKNDILTMKSPIFGLILAGGKSMRMGRDKAAIYYKGLPQLQRAFDLLQKHVDSCFISIREPAYATNVRAHFPSIMDDVELTGPAAGLRAAHRAYPEVAWFVLACDMPLLQDDDIKELITARTLDADGVVWTPNGIEIYPLCAVWEKKTLSQLNEIKDNHYRPLRSYLQNVVKLVTPHPDHFLNANIPADWERLKKV
ncbi:molybdenum cofactor guanylyltransferase [Acetobacter estunensis NRIC 0472]|uniref:Molybdenum cofactor guanylyltransferase n=1 Tax=Acetobacter estunensis TaxID=104097 RepID=A0A967ECI6_9PROT|nr:molybdenum cofactor guanylyltransferase [Acetobacter estunensis]NHO54668.1 NTP transferase domain-containing protein [Acetobacter estunensis]GBQ23012.1 molybdenum cofactor guanylyltransferase [Acetobacter estunensis NRIC 0472]